MCWSIIGATSGPRMPIVSSSICFRKVIDQFWPIPSGWISTDAEWDAVLGRLEQSGVWLQGNLKCLAGREGPKVELRARRLLEEDRYRMLATDMHGTADLGDRLAGLSVVEQHVGSAKLRTLLADVPQEIVMPDR